MIAPNRERKMFAVGIMEVNELFTLFSPPQDLEVFVFSFDQKSESISLLTVDVDFVQKVCPLFSHSLVSRARTLILSQAF